MFELIKYSEIDPTGAFVEANQADLVESCGLLPHFVANPTYGDLDALKAIETQYQYGSGCYMDGTIDDAGVYSFPGDPDLHPLALMVRETRGQSPKAHGVRGSKGDFETKQTEKVYIYQYGIIAVVSPKTGTHIQRMD